MDIPALFQTHVKNNSLPPISINTDTFLDLASGQYVEDYEGKHLILDGGITPTLGVAARPERFKSTMVLSWNVRAWERSPGSYLIIMDSENSINNLDRVLAFSTLYRDDPEKREKHLEALKDRLIYKNKTDIEHLDEFYSFLESDIYPLKEAHRKALTVNTPFVDPRTLKQRTMLVPTFVVFDSWSDIKTRVGLETALSGADSSDTKTNTQYMRDGGAKNLTLGKMVRDAARYGIFFSMTAHISNKFDLDKGPMARPSKDLQNLKVDDRIKKVGGDFSFLTSTLLTIENSSFFQSSTDKSCMYPFSKGETNDKELSKLNMKIVRNKKKGSGDDWSNIVSQNRGDMSDLTNFQLLKDNKNYGITGSAISPRLIFYPDIGLPRNEAYQKFSSDPKLSRACQILAHLCYIQTHWTKPSGLDIPFHITPEDLYKRLQKCGKFDEVMSSRGWWSYGYEDIPYYSIFDILLLVKDVAA